MRAFSFPLTLGHQMPMTMGEFREHTAHIPDSWPLQVADDNQEIFDIITYIVAPELGDRVILTFDGEPAR